MGGKGGAAGSGWDEMIADGGKDGDEPLQGLLGIESPASPARVVATAGENSRPGC